MGYVYNYTDLRSIMINSSQSISTWENDITNMILSMNEIVNDESFTGHGAESIKNYIQEIHINTLSLALQAINEYKAKVLLFVDGLYQFDEDIYARISEDFINDIIEKQELTYTELTDANEIFRSETANVSDIVDVSMPAFYPISSNVEYVQNGLKEFRDNLGEYDVQWMKNELSEMAEYISNAKNVIEQIHGAERGSMMVYEAGWVGKLEGYNELIEEYYKSNEYICNHIEEITTAGEHQTEVLEQVYEDELAKARKEYGLVLLVSGVGALVIGIGTIIVTGGTGTPVVLHAAGTVFGAGASIYGASQTYEGIQEMEYGFMGDATTVAINPIRDTLFFGDQEAYDTYGKINIIACTFIFPIGKSVGGVTSTSEIALGVVKGIGGGVKEIAVDYTVDSVVGEISELNNLSPIESLTLSMVGEFALEASIDGATKTGKTVGRYIDNKFSIDFDIERVKIADDLVKATDANINVLQDDIKLNTDISDKPITSFKYMQEDGIMTTKYFDDIELKPLELEELGVSEYDEGSFYENIYEPYYESDCIEYEFFLDELRYNNYEVEVKGGSGSDLDGVRIINKKYAGKTFKLSGDLGEKYPKGVNFSNEGFPDFETYSIKKVTINNLEGDAYYDFIKANEAAGYSSTPTGYTWHHVEDGKTMLLVPSDLHGAVRHTGGASLIRKGIRP